LSPSLELESEEGLLQVLIDTGLDYFEFWKCSEVIFLHENGLRACIAAAGKELLDSVMI
jgi:hypothetical protein